jgi:hypothetical protein
MNAPQKNNQREITQNYIIEMLDRLAPGGPTSGIYKDFFSKMDDFEFDSYMTKIKNEEIRLIFYAPNFAKPALSVKRNIEIAKTLGHSFFQRLWIKGNSEVPTYLTPVPYLIVELPLRRASQMLVKKMKLPQDSNTVDTLTGQVTGPSKGTRVSFEEMRLMAAMGLDNSTVEFMKYRGGDIKGGQALNAMITKYGNARLETLKHYASGVESTKTFSTFLKAMHLSSTLKF